MSAPKLYTALGLAAVGVGGALSGVTSLRVAILYVCLGFPLSYVGIRAAEKLGWLK